MKFSRNNEILYDQEPYPIEGTGPDPDLFDRAHQPRTVHWSIAWSDLMMTMFIMFLVMYVFHAAKTESTPGAGEPSLAEGAAPHTVSYSSGRENPRKVQPAARSLTVKADTALDISSVDLAADRAVRIILPGDLLFDTGQADIKSTARQSLMRIARIIRQTPYIVNVIGHTDADPIRSRIFATNWELSAARACKVARFLIEEMNLPRERFYVTGHAANLPVAGNATEQGKSRNRRVEIVITRNLPQGTTQWSGRRTAYNLPDMLLDRYFFTDSKEIQ